MCSLNVFCRSFIDVGFKEFCIGGVRGSGLALAMSNRVGELCVVECFLL